jgi:hypothetical protein
MEFVELAYFIKRGYTDEAKIMAKKMKVNSDTEITELGDKITHICAIYGDIEMFDYFKEKCGVKVNVLNNAKETPFMLGAREGRLMFLKHLQNKYGGLIVID